MLIIQPTDLPDVLLLTPRVFADTRGYFLETWNADRYQEAGLPATFVQDNLSFSAHRVLRGLHYQAPTPQGKLVQVLRGTVFDVAVDLRPDAPTYGRWVGHTLSAENHRQMYIPEGFAHGFVVLSPEGALFHYKCTAPYDPTGQHVLRWDDPALGIAWPLEDPILNPRDAGAPYLHERTP
ncbi:MAG: dTDP-4-dehydrorhamnose 3,5-epimerase [Bacteroidota bacterium]